MNLLFRHEIALGVDALILPTQHEGRCDCDDDASQRYAVPSPVSGSLLHEVDIATDLRTISSGHDKGVSGLLTAPPILPIMSVIAIAQARLDVGATLYATHETSEITAGLVPVGMRKRNA